MGKKNHILVQTEEGDQNSKICLNYLFGKCDSSNNCGKIHILLPKSSYSLKGILSFNNPYILGFSYDMIENKLKDHGYEITPTLDNDIILERIRLWMKLRHSNKVFAIDPYSEKIIF